MSTFDRLRFGERTGKAVVVITSKRPHATAWAWPSDLTSKFAARLDAARLQPLPPKRAALTDEPLRPRG